MIKCTWTNETRWNCFCRKALRIFLMRVERFGGYDVWEWLTITNHDESILFWHLCQRWIQKTILKSQSFTNGKNYTNIMCTGSDYNFAKSEMNTFCCKFEIFINTSLQSKSCKEKALQKLAIKPCKKLQIVDHQCTILC